MPDCDPSGLEGLVRRSGYFGAVLVSALMGCAGFTARGADLPPTPIPYPAPTPSVGIVLPVWTGPYVGFHAGFGAGSSKWIDNFPTPDGEIDARPGSINPTAGLRGGYNYSLGSVLLGVEADFTWSDINNKRFNCFFFGDQSCSSRSEWFGSVAGRLGWVDGNVLYYGKGGVAWAQNRYTDVATCAGLQPIRRAGITAACGDTFYGNETRPGWLVGAGVEYMFAPGWSAGVEYNYMDFGSRSISFRDGGSGFFTEQIVQTTQIVKFGLNYHFGETFGQAYWRDREDPEGTESGQTGFVVADVSKRSFAGAVGTFLAPYGDLDASGLRLYLVGEGGAYNYRALSQTIHGNFQGGDILAGYAFEGDNYSINLLAGLNVLHHGLADIDPTNKVQGTEFGIKARGSAWYNPTRETLVFGEGEYSTAFSTYSTVAKLGYDVSGGKQMFFGPMVAVLGDQRYSQFRAGAHLTQISFGRLSFDIAAGYANDSVVGSGGFVNAEMSYKF